MNFPGRSQGLSDFPWISPVVHGARATSRGLYRPSPSSEARENLQLMLFLNLVKLIETFPRRPEKLPLYMQQHLLENPNAPEDPEPEPDPEPPTP